MRGPVMTGAASNPQELGEQFLKSLDKSQLGAGASKLFYASVGEVVTILSRSPSHKHYSLADIEWMVLPAIMIGQFYVIEAAHKENGFRMPAAFVAWAFVSEEVDQRLTGQAGQRLRLHPGEWRSGEVAWIIDVVGTSAGVAAALRWLLSGPLKERSVKAALRDADGTLCIKVLDPDSIGATAMVAAQ